jgi:hypothetical protein
MSATLKVGQTLTESIAYFDTTGAPMATPPTPDSPPVWTQSTPATETLTASADGLSFSGPALAVGTDSVSVTVVAGGQTFTASSAITVVTAPQVLGSVQIVDTVT